MMLPEAAGPRMGEQGKGELISLLILGDSAAAGVGVSHQQQALSGHLVDALSDRFRVKWQLLAKTGNKTLDTLSQLDMQESIGQFDVVITSLGVNDITGGKTKGQWLNEQAKLHQYCLDRLSCKLLIVSGIPPMRKFPLIPQPLRWILGQRALSFDRYQKARADKASQCAYLSLELNMDSDSIAKDGFHPSEKAYKEWALKLEQCITRHVIE